LTLRAVVGLGANLGERLATMRAAVGELRRIARVHKASRVYATVPVGGPPQPEFLNAAALVAYEASPEDLLDALLAIEAGLGRVRGDERWGPRVIDLDLLWVQGLVRDTPQLTLPHPLLRTRAFALVPLVEIAPDARDPRTGDRYADILASLGIAPGTVSATKDSL
jgi:2-amino-4-hydroxy-6-hydroxymethyldihydropteridine diphosphokinase